jgi:hypothetical protein
MSVICARVLRKSPSAARYMPDAPRPEGAFSNKRLSAVLIDSSGGRKVKVMK